MSVDTARVSVETGLLAPPRLLRTVRAEQAPFAGDLRAGDPPALWVRVDAVPTEIWRVRPGEHVLAPLDVARTLDGHSALLPHCPQRLAPLLAREDVSPGAIVTVAVSLLRGAAEAERCALSTGSWWVDAEGRPVLAPVGGPWREDTAALLHEMADSAERALERALRDAAEVIGAHRVAAARREAVEDALFAAADPRPLPRADTGADPGSLSPRRVIHLHRGEETDRERVLRRTPSAAAVIDREIVERVRETLAGLRSRVVAIVRVVRSRQRHRAGTQRREYAHGAALPARDRRGDRPLRSRRRAPLLVAAAVGVAVVVAGLAWPPDGDASEALPPVAPTAATGQPAAAPGAENPGAENPGAEKPGAENPGAEMPNGAVPDAVAPGEEPTTPETAAASPPNAVDAARRVLGALSGCHATAETAAGASDRGCVGIMEDPAAPPPMGLVADASVAREVSLLDEYGGVAVYRITAAGRPSQVLVLVSVDGKWLVRDVYDVADQP